MPCSHIFLTILLLPGIYCLSKAAIHSMTDTLRMELKPFGVDAMVVAPGKTMKWKTRQI
jgi:NAD(P)-dependent dehydrogenase (short-subunit alcohol dehydrogenase family)